MKRALLIGATLDTRENSFEPQPSLDAIEGILSDLGDWSISRISDGAATRAGIVAALAELEAALEPEDSVLLYFVGHGGAVEIRDLPPPLGGRQVFYLAAARDDPEWHFEAVLDVELSLVLARMDRCCANISVILDSCFSARVVRGPIRVLDKSPAWLRRLAGELPSDCDTLLHPTSHPRIVRLTGSSSLRKSFSRQQSTGHLAWLTKLLVETLREAQLRAASLTWDALAHRLREQAIWHLGFEEQWVTLAGPRQRLLFSPREVPLPRTVAFVPDEQGSGGWLRAGALQGIQVGDEWGLAALALGDDGHPDCLARARVTQVDLNRAAVEPVSGDISSLAAGTSAQLLAAKAGWKVDVAGPEGWREAVERSPWLTVVAEQATQAQATMRILEGASVELTHGDEQDLTPRYPATKTGIAAAVEHLEDWARSSRLLEVARTGMKQPRVLEASLHHSRREPRTSSEFHAGDRVCLTLRCDRDHGDWFVNAILIDPTGRPTLLDAAEPEGREVSAGHRVVVGRRPHRREQGVSLTWPGDRRGAERGKLRVILLVSRRPIPVGHLVRPGVDAGIPRPVAPQRRSGVRGRSAEPRPRQGPEITREWSALLLEYELDPRPRAP